MVWDVNKGTPLTALVLHQPILGLAMASDASRIGVQLLDSRSMLIVFLHNTPASYVTLPAYVAPKEMEGKRRRSAQRPLGDASAARTLRGGLGSPWWLLGGLSPGRTSRATLSVADAGNRVCV